MRIAIINGGPEPDNCAREDNHPYLYSCGAGVNHFHIDPYGNLGVCIIARQQQYNLRAGSFKQGWEEFLPAIRQQKISAESVCATCYIRAVCAQCPGWSQLEHNDPQTPVKFICDVAHERAKALKLVAF